MLRRDRYTCALCYLFFTMATGAAQGHAPRQPSAAAPVWPGDEQPDVAAEEAAAILDEPVFANDFAALSLEQLMSVQVTSVAGVQQEWFTTPAAMHVITDEDVRRTGHRSIPEALRLAPGLHVARINSNVWAISARGFNSNFANKLLVMIDGRAVYDPLFSGVYWDIQNVVMEDLAQIEVVRGPGATLWGANAVNGVINIETKSAAETHGWLFTGAAGTQDVGSGAVRYGTALNDTDHLRVWATFDNTGDFDYAGGGTAHDDWSMFHTGFRFDREAFDDVQLMLEGGMYASDHLGTEVLIPNPAVPFTTMRAVYDQRVEGAHLLMKAQRENAAEHSGWSAKAYYDYNLRDSGGGLDYLRHTFDLDLRQHARVLTDHDLLWGVGVRHSDDDSNPGRGILLTDKSRGLTTVSAFVQDTITIAPDRLFAMVGSKFEHNEFTGFEVQPSARVWWTPNESHTVWGAVSRAVRTPSRVENDILATIVHTPFPPPNDTIDYLGNRDLDSEELLAYELGYRVRLSDTLSVDIAAFYNKYENLIGVTGLMFDNVGEADTYGVETAITWAAADNLRVDASHTFFTVADSTNPSLLDSAPQHQFQVRASYDVTERIQLNGAIYYTGQTESLGIREYVRLDVGVRWQVTDQLELALWGQNLMDEGHVEFEFPFFYPDLVEIPRSAYLQAVVRF